MKSKKTKNKMASMPLYNRHRKKIGNGVQNPLIGNTRRKMTIVLGAFL
jgi:hypothetical protein